MCLIGCWCRLPCVTSDFSQIFFNPRQISALRHHQLKESKKVLLCTKTYYLPSQILTQEDWNTVLYNGMNKTSPWAALYFIALMTFGNYVLFNLLVAILVEGFSSEVGSIILLAMAFDTSCMLALAPIACRGVKILKGRVSCLFLSLRAVKRDEISSLFEYYFSYFPGEPVFYLSISLPLITCIFDVISFIFINLAITKLCLGVM